jgi:hypothetical protein
MIVSNYGGMRDYEFVYVTFGEHDKFANKVVRLVGWLYRQGGKTIGGGGLPLPENSEKPTFYFSTDKGEMDEVVGEDANRVSITDKATVNELLDYILSESKKGNSNYYIQKISGYYGL